MASTWTGSTPGEYCWYLSAEYYRVLLVPEYEY